PSSGIQKLHPVGTVHEVRVRLVFRLRHQDTAGVAVVAAGFGYRAADTTGEPEIEAELVGPEATFEEELATLLFDQRILDLVRITAREVGQVVNVSEGVDSVDDALATLDVGEDQLRLGPAGERNGRIVVRVLHLEVHLGLAVIPHVSGQDLNGDAGVGQ